MIKNIIISSSTPENDSNRAKFLHHDIRQQERVCGAWNHRSGTECGCLFRPPLPFMGTWLEREQQWAAATVFPQGDGELTRTTQEQVQWAVDRLNHRPRKVLGFRTPFEAFFGKTVRCTKPPLGVALRNWIRAVIGWNRSKVTSQRSRNFYFHELWGAIPIATIHPRHPLAQLP